ncbi:MAG TPA: hypothetical protein VHM19_23400 [Polyangiales bacterium]|jgi:hypothetical protein|nr:hypothetical protein [Polyangiales bacterium]
MIRIVRELKAVTGARTWQVEAAFVAFVLAGVAFASHKGAIEWLGVLVVFFTWMHASVADRMAEQHAAQVGGVECHRWAGRYYWAKELLWFSYFAWIGAWSALAGCVLFLVWPLWRKAWRSAPKRARRHIRAAETGDRR